MTLKITPLRVLLALTPLFLLVVALITKDALWLPGKRDGLSDAAALIGMMSVLAAVFGLSFSPTFAGMLSTSFWYRGVPVRSNSGQASVAVVILRLGSLTVMYLLSIAALFGPFR